MNNVENAYMLGFFKRAAEYGFSEEQAVDMLNKLAGPQVPKTLPAAKQMAPAVAKPSAADLNDRAASKGNYVPKPLPNPKTVPLEY